MDLSVPYFDNLLEAGHITTTNKTGHTWAITVTSIQGLNAGLALAAF